MSGGGGGTGLGIGSGDAAESGISSVTRIVGYNGLSSSLTMACSPSAENWATDER